MTDVNAGVVVLDANGVLITGDAPAGSFGAKFTVNLPVGVYDVEVFINSNGPTFSEVGGRYTLTVTTTPNRLPVVTVNAPAATNDSTPQVSVTVSDPDGPIPDGTAVRLDVDLNNDGDFLDRRLFWRMIPTPKHRCLD